MTLQNIKTPGVYITEIDAFAMSVIPVATALPAFIGYTPGSTYQGKSYAGIPVQVSSWSEFTMYFGGQAPVDTPQTPSLAGSEPHAPLYHLTPASLPEQADINLGGQPLSVRPDPATIYYLYNSLQLFFQNGGGRCYVVSVGGYGAASGQPLPDGAPLANPGVTLADLRAGLAALSVMPEVTIVLAPDAVLLPPSDYPLFCQAALEHCAAAQTCVTILDVQKGARPDPQTWPSDIQAFRDGVGTRGLSYGVAYYPFLKTAIGADTIGWRNLASPAATLQRYLPGAGSAPLAALIAGIAATPEAPPADIEQSLRSASPDYARLVAALRAIVGVLPPSGAMAGIYAKVDAERGVWHAPANLSPAGVSDLTLRLDGDQQALLNVDAVTGKSINALRYFVGRGILVWGARTLDGNSPDWRYIQVRRTIIYLEQSIKLALQAYVFSPNTGTVWATVKSQLAGFLNSQWKEGALVGATADAAFSVSVGLGSTMTSDDILNGLMRVSVQVAIARPAEFIVLNFEQRMAASS